MRGLTLRGGLRRRACAATLALLPLAAGCVDGDYNRSRVYQEPPVEGVEALAPGVTDVGAALDSLGAPVFVIEIGLGLALAWGWQDTTDWNIDVSAPLGDAQGNFSFTSIDTTTRGIVLFFDEDWKLTSMRRGYLSQLLPRKALPRDVDDELRD